MEKIKRHKTLIIVIVCVVVALIVSLTINLFLTLGKTTANPREFTLNNNIRVTVNKDTIIYNEEHQQDDIYIYMTAKNIGEVPEPLELENTTGYNENTPTTDQLTEEDIQNLDYYETERINEKTFHAYSQEMNKYNDVDSEAFVQAFQDSRVLQEPINVERPYPEFSTNYDALSGLIQPGQSYEFALVFALESANEMILRFTPVAAEDTNGKVENIDIHFQIDGRQSPQMQAKIDEENEFIYDKQTAEYVEWTAADFTLVDNWYVDDQQKVNIRFKNKKYKDVTINVNYTSSGTAADIANSVVQWNEENSKDNIITIESKDYYYIEREKNNFVLVTTGRQNYPIKFTCTGVELNDVMNFIRSINY